MIVLLKSLQNIVYVNVLNDHPFPQHLLWELFSTCETTFWCSSYSKPRSAVKVFISPLCARTSISVLISQISGGSGRTGTFIMLDRLHQQLESQDSGGEINLFNAALDLRNARTHMIQTEVNNILFVRCYFCRWKPQHVLGPVHVCTWMLSTHAEGNRKCLCHNIW